MTTSDLTNEQLDRMIAEKRGWEYSARGFEVHIGSGLNFPYKNKITGKFDVRYPSFTTDPRCAMELLKEMADTGNTIVLFKENDKYTLDGEADNCVGVADTPERAIAEAWLEWKK